MPHRHKNRLIIDNRVSELQTLEAWLASIADNAGLTPRTRFALDLVLNEALINIINYGYEDDEVHQIGVSLEDSATAVVLHITDTGRPFDPLQAAPMQAASDLESAPLGGRGIHLIRSYSDELSYHHCEGKNNLRLVIYKRGDNTRA